MGLFRKMTSIGTGGLVDFRSDKERTARYAKQLRNEARIQNRMLRRAGTPSVLTDSLPELERLADLHRRGDLTDDEFRAAKAKILGVTSGPPPAPVPAYNHRSLPPPAPDAPPGWYPDPIGRGQRWWGGPDGWASHPRP